MSLARVLIVIGLAIGGYLLYTKFAANKSAPTVQPQPMTQEQSNAIQISNLGLDSTTGIGSVVLSAIGNAGVSDAAIKEFVNTHDYGAFTRDVLNTNAKQAAQAQPVFTSRAAATAWAKSHS